jgi:hypothetical protein
MNEKQATAEVFVTAFRALGRAERTMVVRSLLLDREFADDLMDIVLCEQSRQEKGKDVPLEDYLRAREKQAD